MLSRAIVLLAAIALAPSSWAQSQGHLYKCVDARGKVYYTQLPPPECAGRPSTELDKSGSFVVKQNAAPLTAEERAKIEAQKEADRKRKAEEAERLKEERRLSAALLNTYSSVNDIEDARARALKDNAVAVQDAERHYADALKRQDALNKEKTSYANKALPRKLELDLETAGVDIQNWQQALDARRKEASAINARYDEDKRRYVELTRATPKR